MVSHDLQPDRSVDAPIDDTAFLDETPAVASGSHAVARGEAIGGSRSLAGRVIDRALRVLAIHGTFDVTYANGETVRYEGGPGPTVGMRFATPELERAVVLDPDLGVGEGYMDGTLTVTRGTLRELALMLVGLGHQNSSSRLLNGVARIRKLLRHRPVANRIMRSRAHVAHHYDLDARFYDLFLDEDHQYSCAYFPHPDVTLEEAQRAKKERIFAKLRTSPGQTALDIGCGWGGLGLRLAEGGLDVLGITLSEEQLAVARDRARMADLGPDRLRFELRDYRELEGTFDRIVSVGMLEHVGRDYLTTYFARIADLLAEDGVALVHSIGRYSSPRRTSVWLTKHIFPGGYIPSLSETVAAIERAGLMVTDVEILRLHYAETLRHWSQRFTARREEAKALYDERFCRMWEFYLAAAEAGFRGGDNMVFQIQVAKDRTATPQTRGYMDDPSLGAMPWRTSDPGR